MYNEIKEILDKLKESVDNPIIDVQTYDGSDSEPMDNIAIIKPNACKQILDYITNLQSNWNSLRDYLIQLQKLKGINQQGFSWGVAQEILDKMNELDYITDLQQENESWRRVATKNFNDAEDYKSRIDKAIEYISDSTDENDYLFLLPSQVSVLFSILKGDSNE